MKLLALADIHHSEEKWGQLLEAVQFEKPDLVAIAGDLVPKYNGTLAQLNYLPQIRKCARAIKEAGAELVIILGNDDNQLLVPEMERGDREGLWHYVADRVKLIQGFEFCGCPWIRDYPFGYKYWVATDDADQLYINELQLGPPLLINEQNEIEEIADFGSYLKGKLTISDSLENMTVQVQDLKRSIWLIHEPPAYLGFDHCASGAKVGSPVIFNFIEKRQPLLTIHGHIHEAPKYNGGIWAAKIGNTTSIQAGQLDGCLYYVDIKIVHDRIPSIRHSVYGESQLL